MPQIQKAIDMMHSKAQSAASQDALPAFWLMKTALG
jgi:hypothetical protein